MQPSTEQMLMRRGIMGGRVKPGHDEGGESAANT